MNIAIIGAGLAGLATGWHLLSDGHKVTFFDEKGVGQGTSGIAAGLLHPYVGEKARRSWYATEGLSSTEELLRISEQATGDKICTQRGLLRTALNAEQRQMLLEGAATYRDVEEIEENEFILHTGMTVDVPLYLKGLFRACAQLGAIYKEQKVSLDSPVEGFDRTVFACGKEWLTSRFAEGLPLKATKGQVLLLRCSMPIEKSRISKGYIAVTADPYQVYLGATYERGLSDDCPCIEVASAELLPRAPLLLPPSCTWEVLGCRAGVRLIRQGSYIPFVEKLDETCWWIGAFGSRGLLYHAYLGKKLAEALSANSTVILPKEVRRA